MRRFEGVIRTNKQGSDCTFEFEVEDDATPEDIDEAARDAAFENIEWSCWPEGEEP